jgi:hypothetical protein
LSSSDMKYDEVLRVDMQIRAVIPICFCETQDVVFVTCSHITLSSGPIPPDR